MKASSLSLILFKKKSYLILAIYSFIKIFKLHQFDGSNLKWISFLYKHLEDS